MRTALVSVALSILPVTAAAGNPAVPIGEEIPLPESLERHARDYRIQVYRTFRGDRREFDRRRAVWSEVQTAWRDAGNTREEQNKLIDWLTAATLASAGRTLGPLPEPPVFGAEWLPPSADEGHRPSSPRSAVETNPSVISPARPADVSTPVVESPPRPPTRTTVGDDPTERNVARINLGELAARVAGHNFSLRAVETDLIDAREVDVRQLESAIEVLERLTTRRQDLVLYYGLLSTDDQSRVGRIEVPGDVFALLGDRISELRTQVETSSHNRSNATSRVALFTLDTLSKRLAEIYTKNHAAEEDQP